MKYRLSPREIPRAPPSGFPLGSGDISLYTPPLVTIQLQSATGMVWYGMVWYGIVWYIMEWYGMVWYGMVWYGMVWYGMVWFGGCALHG